MYIRLISTHKRHMVYITSVCYELAQMELDERPSRCSIEVATTSMVKRPSLQPLKKQYRHPESGKEKK